MFNNTDKAHYKYALDNNRKIVKIRSDKYALYYNNTLEYYFRSLSECSMYLYDLTVMYTDITALLISA